nr:C40 family peptidase [Brachybacterium muris]
MAAGILLGGASAAVAEPGADAPAPQADAAAAPVLLPVAAPAVGIPAAEAAEEAAPSLAPAAGAISVTLPEPEPEPEPEPVVEEEQAQEEQAGERTDRSENSDRSEREDGQERRSDDERSSHSNDRSSRSDDERSSRSNDRSSRSDDEQGEESSRSEQKSEKKKESSNSGVSAGKGSSILATARSGIGTPYVFGGTSPSGWDCSGFVQWVYAQHGISLPRGASDQAAAGRVIPRSEARPGDLVYKPGHIGIYAGGNQFVDAGNSRVDTTERKIYSGNWTFIRVGG